MPASPRSFARAAAALLLASCALLGLAAPAAAQVSIVPGSVKGGSTETFAFRLANQRTDTQSNRLEIVFPQSPPIAFAEVKPARGWTAKINPRPLDPPQQSGDRLISQVVGSIVLEGGEVGPGQFEQFLVTLGPLPEQGDLVLDTVQGYTSGASDRFSAAAGNAPVIVVSPNAAQGAPPPAVIEANRADQAVAAAEQQAEEQANSGGITPFAFLWGVLGLAFLVVALVGLRTHLLHRRAPDPEPTPEPEKVSNG